MAKKKKTVQAARPDGERPKVEVVPIPEKERLLDSVSVCAGLGATIGGVLGLLTSFILSIARWDTACLIGLVVGSGLGALYHAKMRTRN